MKKLFKSLLALSLSLIIAFGSVSAFAAEEKDSITWDDAEYTFVGTLTEGKNTVTVSEEECVYYSFNAEKAGYYLLTFDWTDFSAFCASQNIENGLFTEEIQSIYIDTGERDSETDSFLFFFEEGETALVTYSGYDAVAGNSSEIVIEFYGETVSDIDFKGGIDYFLVPNYNIYEYDEENNPYPDYSYYLEGDETQIIFDGDKTLSAVYCLLICSSKTEITEGEFEVDVYFGNETFKKTVSVYPVSKEITKIEVADIENYLTVAEAYNGNIIYDFDGMKLTLTYADGHTETVTVEGGEWMSINLLNGNLYSFPLDYYYLREDDGVNFCVTLAGEEYINAECTLREATKTENRQHFTYIVYEILSDTLWDIKYNFYEVSWAETLWDTMVCFRKAVFNLADELFSAFERIAEEYFEYKKA